MITSSTILAAFKTPKYGSKASNCADSFAISKNGQKMAIADGVSKSYMPKYVAEALTNLYVTGEFDGGTLFNEDHATELLSKVISEWDKKSKALETSVDEETAYDLEYQRELYGMGASTFAGICIDPETFSFDILGDSCIFLLPEDRDRSPLMLTSMPCEINMDNNNPFQCQFGIYPHFVDTKGRIVGEPLEKSIKSFNCTILLATDAFSDWFCRNYTFANGNQIITSIKEIDTQEKFDSFINHLRDIDLKNDDVAVILAEVRILEDKTIQIPNIKEGADIILENNSPESIEEQSFVEKSDNNIARSESSCYEIPIESSINIVKWEENPNLSKNEIQEKSIEALDIQAPSLKPYEECEHVEEEITADVQNASDNKKFNILSIVRKWFGLN